MRAGWSSVALERYASHRFGEDIPSSTFRSYKRRAHIEIETSKLLGKEIDPDKTADVVATRQELIALQLDRIGIDAKHERDMSKLFSSTGREIELLSKLLDSAKADLQDLGVFPVAAQEMHVTSGPGPADAPKYASLGDVISDPSRSEEMAKVLHMVLPNGKAAGQNGGGV